MSPGAVSHIRARATSGRSARPRTIICSTASRLCDSATANMTFCNDATSIAPLLRVRDTPVKQLVQILVDAMASEIPARAGYWLYRRSPSDGSFFIHKVKHILIHNSFKTDFFLDRASKAHSVLPESSLIPTIMQPIRCLREPTFRHSPILQHVFFATVPTDPRPEPSLTFLILVIYKCCPDLDVFVAQRLPRPFRLDSLACRKDF